MSVVAEMASLNASTCCPGCSGAEDESTLAAFTSMPLRYASYLSLITTLGNSIIISAYSFDVKKYSRSFAVVVTEDGACNKKNLTI